MSTLSLVSSLHADTITLDVDVIVNAATCEASIRDVTFCCCSASDLAVYDRALK